MFKEALSAVHIQRDKHRHPLFLSTWLAAHSVIDVERPSEGLTA